MSNSKIIQVPQLGESISEATVSQINVKIGDSVKVGDIMFALETDKVTLEVNATYSGVVTELNVSEGDSVNVGDQLALIAEGAKGKESNPIATPKDKIEKKEEKEFGPKNSPAANKIMSENNINKDQIQGTGKDGRITKNDVINASNCTTAMKASRSENRVKLSRLRQKIAERLKDAQNTAAILTTFNEVDMSTVMELRKKYKETFEKKYDVKLGFMSFFVSATVNALKEIPAVNAFIEGDSIVYHDYMDIGIAVGTDKGLVVPVLRDAQLKNMSEIERSIASFAKKARDGTLTIEELTGGTFSISNGGAYGSLMSTPILNPPQSAILGMHSIQERPVVVDGKIEIRPMMYLALSYDHRIIDGKEAVTFLLKIKQNIEDPARILMGL